VIGLLTRYRQLRASGILGMNRRNAECILDHNPRSGYPAVDAKLKMRDLCAAIGVPTPEIYGVVPAHSALRRLPRLLAGRAEFVVKPNRGAGGRGILVITGREGGRYVRHNGERLTDDDLRQHVSGIISGLFSLGGQPDEALLQERVVPHPSFERVSYRGIPDVRVLTYREEPAMAMLRLPTRQSGGRANLHQGGIGAGVDLATGVTTRAVRCDRLAERHPDTGERVVGFRVPCWAEILDMARRVSRAVELGYLGVDIVLDGRRGPLLLEANARPGLAIQIANGAGLCHRLEEIDRALGAAPGGES
jgi:alpha-L-glutamate ligase-like protein